MESILLFAALILGTYHALRGMEQPSGANNLSLIQQQLLGDPHLDIEQCVYRILVKDQKTRPVLICRGKLQRIPFTLHIWHHEQAQHIELSFHDSPHAERLTHTIDRTFGITLQKRVNAPIVWAMQGDRIRYIRALAEQGCDKKITRIFKHINKKAAAHTAVLEIQSPHQLCWSATCAMGHAVAWSDLLEHLAQVRHHVPAVSHAPVAGQELCLLLSRCSQGLAPLLLDLQVERARRHEETSLIDQLLQAPFQDTSHALLASIRAHDFFSSPPHQGDLRPEDLSRLEEALYHLATKREEATHTTQRWPQTPVAHLTALRLLVSTPPESIERACFWFVRTTHSTSIPGQHIASRTAWLVHRHEQSPIQMPLLTQRLAPAILSSGELLLLLDIIDTDLAERWHPFLNALTLPAFDIERVCLELLDTLLHKSSKARHDLDEARLRIVLYTMRAHGHGATLHQLEALLKQHKKRIPPLLDAAIEATLQALEERAKKGAISTTSQDLRGNLSILPPTPSHGSR